jgi:hypothetical protein
VLAAIEDDDSELSKILRGIPTAVKPIRGIIEDGPFGRSITYDHLKPFDEIKPNSTGLLYSWTALGHRFVDAVDEAKYYLALRRLDKPPISDPRGRPNSPRG